MTFRIHHRKVTVSTNLDARNGVPGDVFTADEQTSGRGRLDHRWFSAPGKNLMLSVVLDVADLSPERVATLPLAVGLAVHATVSCALGPNLQDQNRSSGSSRTVRLKWPNDVLVGGRKIAGILCERNGDTVIAGVGVNVNQTEFAPEIARRATSLKCEGASSSVEAVRDSLLAELGPIYGKWREGGFAVLQARYAEVDFLKGRSVSVRQTDDDALPLTGMCGGVQENGTLLVGGQFVYAGEAHVCGY